MRYLCDGSECIFRYVFREYDDCFLGCFFDLGVMVGIVFLGVEGVGRRLVTDS